MADRASTADHIVVGIDAGNIRGGGGVTHLRQVLSAADPSRYAICRVVVWSNRETCGMMPDRPWLEVVPVPLLDASLICRVLWQQLVLPRVARREGCGVLFSPGGTVPLLTRLPRVTMSQNMLPWQPEERSRFAISSWMYWKLVLLRYVQGWSFRRADGVILLTEHARQVVCSRVDIRNLRIVPHGVEERFFTANDGAPEPESSPYRLLYVSAVAAYKHQEAVVQAVARLRALGYPLVLELVGRPLGAYGERVLALIGRLDPGGEYLSHRGALPFADIHHTYRRADGFVFASSCENLPNILLEAMAAGLPIACSNREPMPEILRDAGVYFDPERTEEVAAALRRLMTDRDWGRRLGAKARDRAREFTWERCADMTLEMLASAVRGGR